MEFDWLDTSCDLSKIKKQKEIEESFEDPFAVRLLPDGEYAENNTRFFCLGRSISNRAIFSLFWTNGKLYRVIISREMTVEEEGLYERLKAQAV